MRDSSSDWDSFELVVGYLAPLTAEDPGPLWISTENYKRRSRAFIGGSTPSPDWEFSAADNETANTRLRDIAIALKGIVEGRGKKLAPTPPVSPAK